VCCFAKAVCWFQWECFYSRNYHWDIWTQTQDHQNTPGIKARCSIPWAWCSIGLGDRHCHCIQDGKIRKCYGNERLKGLVEQAASYYVKGCVLENTSALHLPSMLEWMSSKTHSWLSTVLFLKKSLVVDVIRINNIEREKYRLEATQEVSSLLQECQGQCPVGPMSLSTNIKQRSRMGWMFAWENSPLHPTDRRSSLGAWAVKEWW
jgi:hypothetical protein